MFEELYNTESCICVTHASTNYCSACIQHLSFQKVSKHFVNNVIAQHVKLSGTEISFCSKRMRLHHSTCVWCCRTIATTQLSSSDPLQEISKRYRILSTTKDMESYPQHYRHKVHWNKKWLQSHKYCANGKNQNIWAGTFLLQSYWISVFCRVFLVMCPQILPLVLSVTGHLRFPWFSMPPWFLPV